MDTHFRQLFGTIAFALRFNVSGIEGVTAGLASNQLGVIEDLLTPEFGNSCLVGSGQRSKACLVLPCKATVLASTFRRCADDTVCTHKTRNYVFP